MNIKQVSLRVLGVILILAVLCLGALLFLPYFVKIDKHRPQKLKCELNLKQIGLGFRQWAIDHDNQYPFNVSTNSGGTRELVLADAEGFDLNSHWHFMVASNELNSPKLLVCPQDKARFAATNFAVIKAENVTYRVNISLTPTGQSSDVFVVCPIEGNVLYRDGTVAKKELQKR